MKKKIDTLDHNADAQINAHVHTYIYTHTHTYIYTISEHGNIW